MQGTHNRRRAHTAGDFDDCRGEFPRAPARSGIEIGQAQLVSHPASPRSNRGEPEAMLGQKLREPINVEFLGRTGKNLDRIEPQRSGLLATGRQVVPKDERAAAGLWNQRNRDGGAHLGSDA